jgi:anaerobic ribonucleoside-triphosphate reductase activating protein
MNYTTEQITFQEVPNEISLSFLIAGCPLKCKGCHSADSWRATSEASEAIKSKIHPINNNVQNQLTTEYLENRIKQYQDMISCVLFLGGEWKIKQLIELLQTVKNTNPSLKTCLYTGLELDEIVELIEQEINEKVEIGWKYIFDNNLLDYLKTGRWIRELGGLDNKKTNQQFYKVNVNHEERSSSSYTSKSSEVGIFSRNNSSSGLFTIDMDNNCSDNSTKSQSNIKQALSNILIDKTWMFH